MGWVTVTTWVAFVHSYRRMYIKKDGWLVVTSSMAGILISVSDSYIKFLHIGQVIFSKKDTCSSVTAVELSLSFLFRGRHHPAGACERTDRSQVTTLRDVLSHAPA